MSRGAPGAEGAQPGNGAFPRGVLWTGRRFAAVLGAWFLGGVVGAIVTIALGIDAAGDPVGLAVAVLGQAAGAFIVIYLVSRDSGSGSLRRDVGFVVRPRDLLWLLGGFVLQFAAALVVYPIIQLFVDDPDTQQQVAQVAEGTSDTAGRLVLVLMFVVVAPLIEELIFRGVLLSWLAQRMTIGWAVVLSAAVFAAVHLTDPEAVLAVPGLFIIGLGLGWAAQRYGSLSVPILLHAGVNLTATIALFYGDELLDYLERTRDGLDALGSVLGFR